MNKVATKLMVIAIVACGQLGVAQACHKRRVITYCAPVYVYPACTPTAHAPAPAPMTSKPARPVTVTKTPTEDRASVAELLAKAAENLTAGETESALKLYSRAIAKDPQNSVALKSRGIAYLRSANYTAAVADLVRSVELAPNDAQSCGYLAYIYGACPVKSVRDSAKAIVYATKACELTEWKNPEHLVALGSAYAEAGDFAKAVDSTEKAIKLAAGGSKQGIELVLTQFQRGQAIP